MDVNLRSFGRRRPLIILGVALFATLIAIFGAVGINDGGYRTVVQWPNGKLFVKFSEGIYLRAFGNTTVYPNIITFDFDKTENPEGATLDQLGVAVRYQDGGTGTVFGLARFSLPDDEAAMLELHRDFRSANGVGHKLIKSVSEEAMNLTAGLMTSEEAYAEQRGTFTSWAQQQISGGKFLTKLETISVEDEVTGKRVTKQVPRIDVGDDGLPKQQPSAFTPYTMAMTSLQITDWDFEPKTLEQISLKREANMAIITSKANAERAKQEAEEAVAQGEKNVTVAKYEEEVKKERAVVVAEREKEVAEIAAAQRVAVAEQAKLEAEVKARQLVAVATEVRNEAEQKKLAAAEYKEEQVLRGEGDAAYKQLVLEADGALAQKLEAMVTMNADAWTAIAEQRWVPEIMMGASSDADGEQNAAMSLIQLMLVNNAKQLGLDMSIAEGARVQ